MRTEKKFKIDKLYLSTLKKVFFNLGVKEIYSKRLVSSIYYDTPEIVFYNKSVDGISNRKKIRLRFYNNSFDYQIEYKNKKDDLNFKNFVGINEYKEASLRKFDSSSYFNFDNNLLIPKKIDFIYSPIIFITYKRNYYFHTNSNTRFTIDRDIFCSKIIYKNHQFSLAYKLPIESNILEVKNNKIDFVDLNLMKTISNCSNLIQTRFSKYCEAISLVY